MTKTISPKYISKLALLMAVLFTSRANGQLASTDSLKQSTAIVAIEQKLMDAISDGNAALWDKYLNANFFIVTEDGSRLSRNEFIASIKPLPSGFSGYIKVIHPKVTFNNNTAVINYVSDEHEFIYGQELHTTYSSMNTYCKSGNGWTMISSQIFEVPQLPVPIKLPVTTLEKYTGTYYLQDTVNCVVSINQDTLYMQKKNRTKEALLPETENMFFRRSDTRGRKLFVTNASGAMIMLERRNGQDLAWKRR